MRPRRARVSPRPPPAPRRAIPLAQRQMHRKWGSTKGGVCTCTQRAGGCVHVYIAYILTRPSIDPLPNPPLNWSSSDLSRYPLEEAVLSQRCPSFRLLALILLFTVPGWAQTTPKVTLETSETLFSVMAAVNACGYDSELASSDPVRERVRAEVARALATSGASASLPATRGSEDLCQFYRDHQQPDASQNLAQYVSLGLNLNGPPEFSTAVREADLPPDASYVLGLAPLLQRFYRAAGLHAIWQAHQQEYEGLVERYHEPISNMLLQTDLYLKLPLSGYVGRRFVVYLEPLAPPGQVNARNYGSDYFIVVSPTAGAPAPEANSTLSASARGSGAQGAALRLDAIRHTYLHYVLDPLAMKHGSALRRLEPLLESIRTAPLDEDYKHDISLLVTESLVRAVEARTQLWASAQGGREAEPPRQRAPRSRGGLPPRQAKVGPGGDPGLAGDPGPARAAAVNRAVEEGFILTAYFYDALEKFEKDPAGIRETYGDWLYGIDVGREKKRADAVVFTSLAAGASSLAPGGSSTSAPEGGRQAASEVVRASKSHRAQLLDLAEQRLASSDAVGAQRLAQQVLDQQIEDPARALFILARAAILNRDMSGARTYLERTLAVAREPRTIAWSHIYLGRIYDLLARGESEREDGANQDDAGASRRAAVMHYQAALAAGDPTPDTRSAAERGLQEPYTPAKPK